MADEVKHVVPALAVAKPAAAKPFQKIGEMNIDENGMDIDAAAAIEAKRAAEKAKHAAPQVKP